MKKGRKLSPVFREPLPRTLAELDGLIEGQMTLAATKARLDAELAMRQRGSTMSRETVHRAIEALIGLAGANAQIAKEIGFGFHALERNK